MSKTFRIIISTVSLVATLWFLLLGNNIFIYSFLSLRLIVSAMFPFVVLLMGYLAYSYYKIIKGDNGFYFNILNIFGAISFLTFIYSNLRFIS